MNKLKFKIWDRVVYKQSRLWIVYRIFSYTVYKKWNYSYTIYTDDEYNAWVYPYQIKKYKPTTIWLTTETIWQ